MATRTATDNVALDDDDEKPVTISSLAKSISSLSSQLTEYLALQGRAEPRGFEADPDPDAAVAPPATPEYEDLRAPLNDAALDLLRLVNGPRHSLFSMLFSQYELAALQVALDRRFFDLVPLPEAAAASAADPGPSCSSSSERSSASSSRRRRRRCRGATLAEIAAGAGMDESRAGQVMNTLATLRIFQQVVPPGAGDGEFGGEAEAEADTPRFTHTAASALLARDCGFHALADMQLGSMLKAASETAAAIRASPHGSSSSSSSAASVMISPFQARYGAPMYQHLQAHAEDAARFSEAMSSYAQFQRQGDDLENSFDWASLGRGKVVDIGGGSGHISLALGRRFTELSFVVQDVSPDMLASGRRSSSREENDDDDDDDPLLGGRLAFQQHDFFTPQPVRDASAYLIRQCLHNHADADCVRVLRALAPALAEAGPHVPLLINDIVMPPPADGRAGAGTATRNFHENHLRRIDMCMLVAAGARQRTEREWRALLAAADPRFAVREARMNPLGIGLLRVHLVEEACEKERVAPHVAC